MMRHAIAVGVALISTVLGACHGGPSTRPPVPAADTSAQRALEREGAAAGAGRTVGVLPFTVATTDTAVAPLAYGLADLLMTDLSRTAQLRVVDRLRLDAIVRELQLGASGRVDTSSAPHAGRLLGARQLVIGRLAGLPGGALLLDVRLGDVASGQFRPAVSAQAPLASILDAEKALALRLLGEMGVTPTPAELAAIQQRPTMNINALLAYSRGVRDEIDGNSAAAAGHYGEAARLDPSFSLARARLTTLASAATAASATHGARAAPLARITAGLVDQVNGLTLSPLNAQVESAADASFPLAQLVTLLITIQVP